MDIITTYAISAQVHEVSYSPHSVRATEAVAMWSLFHCGNSEEHDRL